MSKTITVAADREDDPSKSILPAEVARGVYIENPPGAEALKLMHLLISRAGGRMAEDRIHQFRLAEIKAIEGMRNHSRSSLRKLFAELAGAVMIFDDTEAQCEIVGGFLDQARLDYRDEQSDDLLVSWWFGRAFRDMAEASCHWAIMDRQTVFAMSSKYSLLLFQHIMSLVNMKHVSSKTFTIAELRSVLGVPEGKMKRYPDLRRYALEVALAEISQLSRFDLTSTTKKVGRSVASVTISWTAKPDPRGAKAELDRPKIGRKARRNGNVEQIKRAFPADGSIRYTSWGKVRNPSGTDLDLIASKFREFCRAKGISFDADSIEKIWENYVAKFKRRG